MNNRRRALKRLIPSLLILLVLLNTMGYYFIFWGLEVNNDLVKSRALNEDYYDTSHAITIRIPIALPYQYDNPHFIRAEGKFVHEGESYRLVKQKYERDTLTVICIQDDEDKQIQHALADFVKTFNDSPVDGDVPVSKALQLFIKEYLLTANMVDHAASGWMLVLGGSGVHDLIQELHTVRVAQPPEA